MSSVKTIVRYSSCLFAVALLFGAAVTAFGDSRDINNPTLITSFPNGVKVGVHGIFTYRVNEAGKLVHLRGYWQMADAKVEKTA